jgi:hypothetical protein
MSRYVKFELPDGSTVIMESDERETDIVKAGGGEVLKEASERFEQATDNARKAALVILEKLRSGLADKPDEVEITFGLKASGELGNLVVAKAGVEASYSVTLKWKKAETSQHAQPRSVRSSHPR